ncbi:MAG: transposase, partial [Actinomycetota bacterium]|nr:transposase [Actinomycetota bacterium]
MTKPTVYPRYDAQRVADLLDSPEVCGLIAELQETRQTGRPGYAVRSMVGMALVKSLHALPTWTRTVALVRDHAGLRDVLGDVQSLWA